MRILFVIAALSLIGCGGKPNPEEAKSFKVEGKEITVEAVKK